MIGTVVQSLMAAVANVVVVDDGSLDQTASRAREADAAVVSHALNRGQGAALQTGIDFCLRQGADYLVTFDADGQHTVSDIPSLLEPLRDGACDVTLGSRFLGTVDSIPVRRRLLLSAAVIWTRLTSRLRVTDTHNGLRAFTRLAASKIHLRLDRMAHASELLDQISSSGLRYQEVPVSIRYTTYSRAKGQGAAAAFRILLDHLVGRLLG
jgi:glycosyltransferase involved in cell wall biosynthesis